MSGCHNKYITLKNKTMNSYIRTFLTIAMCSACARTLAQSLSLQQCQQLATDNNLELKAAERKVERAKALQGTAWDIERTNLSLSQDPTSGGSPDNAIALSQNIEFPTVYAARHKQMKAETKAEESLRNVTRLQTMSDIAAVYWQLVYCRERIGILAKQDSVLQRYASLARKRYKAGETRQLEQLAANRMLRENALELDAAKSDYSICQRQLASLIGTGDDINPADAKLSPIDYKPQSYVYAATAEGELAYDRLTVADKALDVAKSGYAPSLSLTLKNQLVISGWDPYHENRARYAGGNFMGFEVGIGIPLFYGAAKAKVKAARKEREIAEIDMHRQQLARQNDYDAALARYNSALNRMQYYMRQGAADAAETERLGTMEYENGEISYIEYVNALQESIDAQLRRAAAINDYNQAVVTLKRIAGE